MRQGRRQPRQRRRKSFGLVKRQVEIYSWQKVVNELYKLLVLAEAFNVFNHTNIYSVNTTAFTYSAVGSGSFS